MGTATKNHNTPGCQRLRLQRLKFKLKRLGHKGDPAPIVRVGADTVRVRRWSEDRAIRRMAATGDVLVPAGTPVEYRRWS